MRTESDLREHRSDLLEMLDSLTADLAADVERLRMAAARKSTLDAESAAAVLATRCREACDLVRDAAMLSFALKETE